VESEDGVQVLGNEGVYGRSVTEVELDGLSIVRMFHAGGDGWADDVSEYDGVRGGVEEFSSYELADEASGSGYEDLHFVYDVKSVGVEVV